MVYIAIDQNAVTLESAMPAEDRFKQAVVTTIAKRAANRCSNPDCGALTSGPTDDPTGSVNVGEAAHIFGANLGSARFDPAMASADRSAITNAIWLCGNCHKLIDDDAVRYPAGLLFEWQRSHERRVSEAVGKAGAELRHRYEERHLEEFGRLSYLAERLIIEKGDYWEYRLTAEVLRFEMAPVLRRWNALKRGLYMKPCERLEKLDTIAWIRDKGTEVINIVHAYSELMNVEFARAWGEPGVAGSDIEIVTTCRLFREMCESALRWEEAVRFLTVDDIFEEVHALYIGIAGHMIDEAAKVPTFFAENLSDNPQPGTYTLNLTLELPEGWSENVAAALERATNAMIAEIEG